MHDVNNGWQYPIYAADSGGEGIEKWTNEDHGNGDPEAVFDIFQMYDNQVFLNMLGYFAHEGFHAFQGAFWDVYATL